MTAPEAIVACVVSVCLTLIVLVGIAAMMSKRGGDR